MPCCAFSSSLGTMKTVGGMFLVCTCVCVCVCVCHVQDGLLNKARSRVQKFIHVGVTDRLAESVTAAAVSHTPQHCIVKRLGVEGMLLKRHV